MATTPAWRRAIDAVDGVVAPRLEQVVRTEAFAVTLGLGAQVQREVRRRMERSTRRAWHLMNLPAGSDVTRLMTQIAELERQVRDLRRSLDQAERTSRSSRRP